MAFNYQSADERLWCSAVINPRRKFINMNTTLEINFKPSPKANEYFFYNTITGTRRIFWNTIVTCRWCEWVFVSNRF